jgi:hypothetical protein
MTFLARFCRISTTLAVLAVGPWLAPASSALAAEATAGMNLDAYVDPVPHPYDQAWYKALFPDVGYLRLMRKEYLPKEPKPATNASASAAGAIPPANATASADKVPSIH